MDKCHAPDCPSLKVPDGKAIENPDVLALFHNGPEWMRLSCDERSGKDRILSTSEMDKKDEREERAERLKEEEVMKQAEVTRKIVELAKKEKSVDEIMAATDSTKIQVKNAINRAKMKGELPYTGPKKLITRSAPRKAPKEEKAAPPAVSPDVIPADPTVADTAPCAAAPADTPFNPVSCRSIGPASSGGALVTSLEPTPVKESPLDFASIHAMIDLAAKMPQAKETLLKLADEIEITARYQLSLVAEIREALSA